MFAYVCRTWCTGWDVTCGTVEALTWYWTRELSRLPSPTVKPCMKQLTVHLSMQTHFPPTSKLRLASQTLELSVDGASRQTACSDRSQYLHRAEVSNNRKGKYNIIYKLRCYRPTCPGKKKNPTSLFSETWTSSSLTKKLIQQWQENKRKIKQH